MEDDRATTANRHDSSLVLNAGAAWILFGLAGLITGLVMVEVMVSQVSSLPSGVFVLIIFCTVILGAAAFIYGVYLCYKAILV